MYEEFLNKKCKEFRQSKRPISLRMLETMLSTRFNLSPDYCKEIVAFWNKKLQGK